MVGPCQPDAVHIDFDGFCEPIKSNAPRQASNGRLGGWQALEEGGEGDSGQAERKWGIGV
jgi:hypothetical protein